jgi:hypothetical protein
VLSAVRELARAVQACSPLGAYAGPLSSLKHLTSIEPIAKALVALPSFLPDLAANTGESAARAICMPLLPLCWSGRRSGPHAQDFCSGSTAAVFATSLLELELELELPGMVWVVQVGVGGGMTSGVSGLAA